MPPFYRVVNFADNQPCPLLVALQFFLQVSSSRQFPLPNGEKASKKKLLCGSLGLGVCPLSLSVSMWPHRHTNVVNAAGLCR